MFKKTAAALLIAGFAASPALAQDQKTLVNEAKGIIKGFATELQGELKAGFQRGGPTEAISVCNTKAPGIADKASKTSGWSVGRSSHKLRNMNNAPDAFEARAIKELLGRQAKGEKAADMGIAMTTIEDGKKTFRFVKAIPTGKVCLACHGTNIAPEVEAKLKELYPMDTARGFSEGEMRGIFTLRKEL